MVADHRRGCPCNGQARLQQWSLPFKRTLGRAEEIRDSIDCWRQAHTKTQSHEEMRTTRSAKQ